LKEEIFCERNLERESFLMFLFFFFQFSVPNKVSAEDTTMKQSSLKGMNSLESIQKE